MDIQSLLSIRTYIPLPSHKGLKKAWHIYSELYAAYCNTITNIDQQREKLSTTPLISDKAFSDEKKAAYKLISKEEMGLLEDAAASDNDALANGVVTDEKIK